MNQSLWIRTGVLAMLLGTVSAEAMSAQDPTLFAVAPVDTVELTLADAQSRALTHNPGFLSERKEYDIATGELTQARVYHFNPELEFEAPGAGSAGALGEYEARLSQEVEWAGQRALRVGAARSGVGRAESSVRDAARRAVARVSAAFYAALASERRLAVALTIDTLNRRLRRAARTQLREGEISPMDANLAEIEAGRARAAVLAARREATSALLALARLAGLPPDQPVRLVEEVPATQAPEALDPDSLLSLALERRPDLTARTRALEEALTRTRLARREAIPNLSVGVFATRDVLAESTAGGAPRLAGGASGAGRYETPRVGLAVRIPFPLFDRNQGVVAERAARAEQARFSRDAAALAIRTEVADAYRAYVAAHEEAEVYERDVLLPARENQALLERAFRAGKVGLPTLVLLRNQLLDAELGYLDAWLARRRALVALDAATAGLPISADSVNPRDDR